MNPVNPVNVKKIVAKILLIDNQLLWQRTLSKLLQREGYEVVLAGSFEEAKTLLTSTADIGLTFDLIVIDLILDERDSALEGKNLLPLINERNKSGRGKVILFTEQGTYQDTVEASRDILLQYKGILVDVYDKQKFCDGKGFLELIQKTLEIVQKPIKKITLKEDWSEVSDSGEFYGRQEELTSLEEYILIDHCRLVAVLGIAGIGKSSTIRRLAEQNKEQFEYLFWRDLCNAPSFNDVLNDCIKFFSNQQETDLPEHVNKKIALLIDYLKKHRCLIVLDNVETTLQSGERVGQNWEEYEDYGRLIERVGETSHQSCLVLTSREKLKEIASLEAKTEPVRVLQLVDLKQNERRELLQARGVSGTDEEWKELIARYSGNPLALKQVAATIQDFFGGNIGIFLRKDDPLVSEEFYIKELVNVYIKEMKDVARRGHEDISKQKLLLAFLELHDEQTELVEEFVSLFLRRAKEQKLEIIPRAFRLSFLTTVKLYLRKQNIKDYESFSTQKWKEFIRQDLKQCLTEPGPDAEFMNSCLRDVCTVKIYRYVALQIVGGLLTNLYDIFNSDLRILDGGCSINIGAKCLNNLEIFKPIEIAPDISEIIGDTLSQFPIESVRGIDKYQPSLERTLASLFPSEVKFWEEKYTELYSLDKENVDYQQQDILYLDQHEEYRCAFDIVFLGSLLRRFPSHLIADALIQVNYATRQQSFLIMNEQVSKEVIEGGGNYATFILSKNRLEQLVQQSHKIVDLYELLNSSFQFLRYPDENCEKVLPGKDFKTFLQYLQSD